MANNSHWFKVPPKQIGSLGILEGRPVLFHTINKSGSLASAAALGNAYQFAGRDNQFLCRYFRKPEALDEALTQFRSFGDGPGIFIDHNLIRFFNDFPEATYITLLRDPVRRLISCYFWLSTYHPEALNGRDIWKWVVEAGHRYSLSFQFVASGGLADAGRVAKLKPIEMVNEAEEWFDRNIKLFGITEYFEESLMLIASQLGIDYVPIWQSDERNQKRPKWASISPSLLDDISNHIRYDIDFYERKKVHFLKTHSEFIESPEISEYKNVCTQVRKSQELYGAE